MDDKLLSQNEINALLQGIADETDEPAAVIDPSSVSLYKFTAQEHIVRGRMPSLDLINDRFTRLLRIGLYHLLRSNPEISVSPIKNTKYSEFLRNMVVPTNINLVKITPLHGIALIVMDPQLVFLFVEHLFGGNGRLQTRIEGRDFSQIEHRIIQRILKIIFASLVKAWEVIYPVDFVFISSEANAQFANIATPNEMVITTAFHIELGGIGGDLHICLPNSLIEPIKELLRSSLHRESNNNESRWAQLLKYQINDANIDAVADLCTINSTLRQVLNMKVGDIIPFEMPETIEVSVDYVPIMTCSYGKLNGQYALQIEDIINYSAEIP